MAEAERSVRLDAAQRERARGVLLGQACGDALGVPYEFATPPGPGQLAEMLGGGLGDFAPGEWSDDTAMAVALGEGLLAGSVREAGAGFLRWYADGPADIGIQTRQVLSSAATPEALPAAAEAYARDHAHAAGNGALMRTSPVALAHLADRAACAATARAAALLTHADPLPGDSSVLWSEAIRVAVTEGRFDLASGLDLVPASRRGSWADWISEAEQGPPSRFRPNGFTVTALQAAWSAVVATPIPKDSPGQHFQDALHAAVRIGDDTDTVAAIAGGLLGARWGVGAVPERWRAMVHGWPGRNGDSLVDLANRLAVGGLTTGP